MSKLKLERTIASNFNKRPISFGKLQERKLMSKPKRLIASNLKRPSIVGKSKEWCSGSHHFSFIFEICMSFPCFLFIQLSKIKYKQALNYKCKLKRLVSKRPIAKSPQPTYKLINKNLMSDCINFNEDLLSHSIFEICIFPFLLYNSFQKYSIMNFATNSISKLNKISFPSLNKQANLSLRLTVTNTTKLLSIMIQEFIQGHNFSLLIKFNG